MAIHGGAGVVRKDELSREKEAAYKLALTEALNVGWTILQSGGASLDAVETAVSVLEDNSLFNAGRGAVFTNAGTHEMDAALMSGADLRAGAVAAVTGVRNPISLARRVMDESPHVLMCGAGAIEFAREVGIAFESPDYFFDQERYRQLVEAKQDAEIRLDHSARGKIGTVGAVACDAEGNVAAATSTGGMTNKRFGRIGDSSMIGAGTYADNHTCAVSCTGHGEFFIRAVAAFDVSCLMKYRGLTVEAASEHVVNETLLRMGGEGGLIAVDARGNIALPFNSEGMYRASIIEGRAPVIAIYRD